MSRKAHGGELPEWTAEELLAELRRRERAVAGGAGRKRTRSAAAAPGRLGDLRSVATGDLARMVQDRQRVVYGVDDRRDLFQVSSTIPRRTAAAVVALVKTSDLAANPDGSFTLATDSYQHAYDLCGSEPFVNQPIGCFCSGFLVAPDVVATAGHCIKGEGDLSGVRFVFGFRMIDAEEARTTFPADDAYRGRALIGRQLAGDGTDWALVRLDREVVGRKPVSVRKAGKVASTQALFVIGHPCGLPQKYAPGARVRDNTPAPFFVANLDTYGGNSGSPVFDAKTGVVEGILVRGENDFVTNGDCYVSLVCPTTGCRGEDVTRATIWSAKIPMGKVSKGIGGVSKGKVAKAAAGGKSTRTRRPAGRGSTLAPKRKR